MESDSPGSINRRTLFSMIGAAAIGRTRVGDLANGQIGRSNATVNGLVLFPEATLELQAGFHRRKTP